MDVIFHRNCMDGAFSAHLMYMFCKTLSKQGWDQFVNHLKQHTSNQLEPFFSQQILMKPCQAIKEDFFHTKSEIPFHSVSMHAGDLFPIAPSAPGNVLFVVDISPSTKQMMVLLAERFKYVVILDHHTTFSNCLSFIQECNLKNVFYLWNEKMCAAQLVQNYLFRSFGFPKNLPKHQQQKLTQQIQYVAANDLKINQNRTSKQFTLGFYYFQIELSHQNPLLFKRLWGLDMETILLKGQRAYKDHIDCLIRQVENCEIYKAVNSKFKNTTFLGIEMSDRGLTSDLGTILAYLSVRHKFQNLAMIYKKGSGEYRISFRSYQFVEQKPMALDISVFYGGGGHVCAAGCFITKNTFRQHFKQQGKIKPAIKLTREDIQSILFKQGN